MTATHHQSGPLTDTQLILLSAAAQRADRLVVAPDTLTGRALSAAFKPLLKRGLVTEIRVRRGQPHWRSDDANQRIGVQITDEGLATLGITPEEPDQAPERPRRASRRKPIGPVPQEQPPKRARPMRKGKLAATEATPRASGTKRAHITALLSRKAGASLAELITATGWLPHTTRAALTRLRQAGCALERSTSPEGLTIYQLTSAAPATKTGKPA